MNIEEMLSKKRLLLLTDDEGSLRQVIIDPVAKRLTLDNEHIKLGGFYSDQVHGWYTTKEVAEAVVSVLKEFEDES